MSEISGTRPLPAGLPANRSNAGADLALKLLQPLDGLLGPGQSAKAEVVAVQETAQSFQVLLKLTLDNGRETTVEAESPRALPPGSAVNVTALSETRLAVIAQAGAGLPLESLDLDQVPVGTLLQGKVVASQQMVQEQTQKTLFRIVAQLLNGPLGGQRIAVDSSQPLPLGSLLTAQVRGAQALQFIPLSLQLDQLEVTQQLSGQQSRQGSLDALFKALQGLSSNLPGDMQASLDDLLDALPDLQKLSDPSGLSKAMGDSGLLLEAKLLAGQTGALAQDLKANLLRLIAQMAPNLPNGAGSLPAAANVAAALTQALPAFVRNALGALGQNGLRQQGITFPLPARLVQTLEKEGGLEGLLKLAAAAVSRLQTHQLSSLAQSQAGPDGTVLTTWQLELPMRQHQDIVPLQVKVQREEDGAAKGEQQDALWRVELAFDLSPLGPMQVQAQLLRGSVSSQIWAERSDTATLIDGELSTLRERLMAAGLAVGDLDCRQGVPPQGRRTVLDHRWIDETA